MQLNDVEKEKPNLSGGRKPSERAWRPWMLAQGAHAPRSASGQGAGTISSGTSSSTLFSGGRKKRNKIKAANKPTAAGTKKSLWKSYWSLEIWKRVPSQP